jgi:glycosyltransferase involved in cell wall biosynthesis
VKKPDVLEVRPTDISVVITNYNKGMFLLRAIESVAQQTVAPGEIIIVDDASDDPESIRALAELQKSSHKCVLLANAKREGASLAKNRGTRAAKGTVIMLLDGDDTLPPTAIDTVASTFNSFPEADFVFGDVARLEGKVRQIAKSHYFARPDGDLGPQLLARSWGLYGTTPFRASVFEKVGGFDGLHPRTDDIDFFRRAILSGCLGRYVPEVIYNYHLEGVSNSQGIDPLDLSFSWFRNIDFYWTFLGKAEFIRVFTKKSLLLLARIARNWLVHKRWWSTEGRASQ